MILSDRTRLPPLCKDMDMIYIARNIATGRVKKLYDKSSYITEWYMGKRVKVYMGNKFLALDITRDMVGRRFGEFVVTKRMGSFIHKKKKKKKVKVSKVRGKKHG